MRAGDTDGHACDRRFPASSVLTQLEASGLGSAKLLIPAKNVIGCGSN